MILPSICLALCLAPLLVAGPAPREDPQQLLAEAEDLRAEGSYALALERYRQLESLVIEDETRAWVAARLADCAWRAAEASGSGDPSALEAARERLEELLAAQRRPEQRGRLFAELSESLADFHWTRTASRDWGAAWPHYQAALAHWAASSELELARRRYLDMVWRLTEARGRVHWDWQTEQRVRQVPREVLENAVQVAVLPPERSRANLLLALKLQQDELDGRTHRRLHETFEAAIAHGAGTAWLDDALWRYGRWLESSGRLVVEPGRRVRAEPDFVAALVPYRRLVAELSRGQSGWHEPAVQRIAQITGPALEVQVERVFLPGSLIRYQLTWRNVERIELALQPFDPLHRVDLEENPEVAASSWIETIPSAQLETLRRWEHTTRDEGRHVPGAAELDLAEPLEPGAYLLEARAAGRTARALVLVSSGALVVKSAAGELVGWLCDVETSAPVADAPVRLWERERRREDGRQRSVWFSSAGRTDADGLVRFDLRGGWDSREVLLVAGSGAQLAFSTGHAMGEPRPAAGWRIQAHTDRSAYRPGHEVHWKLVARERQGGEYRTPAQRELGLELVDPRGQVHSERRATLNAFGSAWGSFELAAEDALGEYTARFFLPPLAGSDQRTELGSQVFLRLEEYRLPEFRVALEPAREEDGQPRLLRLGDAVEAELRAEYYFGGGVAGAEVEVLVHQRPYWRRPTPRGDYPWLLAPDAGRRQWWGGPGQLVHREQLVTDADGRASFAFPTPAGSTQDLEYTLEARVVDLSRREETGRGTLRVTLQAYHLEAQVERRVVRPGERVTATFRASDANDRPVAAAGRVSLLRRRWVEVWIDPTGRRVEGPELEQARSRADIFPPPPERHLLPWRPLRREWVEELVAATDLATDSEGLATWRVSAPRAGYHELLWQGTDRWGERVEARASLWVATEERLDLGYVGQGISVVVDRDSFRSGETAPVLVVLDASNRHALFTVQADRLIDARVLHVRGDAKLVELELDERHVPDVHLAAATFLGSELRTASTRVVVPPIEHFYEVEVALEPEELLPGATGTVTVLTTDVDGQPLAAEVSLALVDKALSAIQEDRSIDPRQFFFGDLRGDRVQTLPLMGRLARVRLVRGPDGALRDERQAAREVKESLEDELAESDDWYLGVGQRSRTVRGLGVPAAQGPEGALRRQLESIGYAGSDEEAGAGAEITVRADFRETALWEPALVTDAEGRGTLEVRYPESLTEWRATARAVGSGARVGWGHAEARTRQPLVARVQAPRFFVVGDECLVSLNVANRSEGVLVVHPSLELEGLRLLGFLDGTELSDRPAPGVELAAGEDRRFDWRVRAEEPGSARLVGKAAAGALADGVERSYPVVPHGLEVLVTRSGRVEGEGVLSSFELPAERAPGTTEVVIQVAPNLALTMLDALPYLIDYPYGCTEQTLSRFLPAVVVQRTLSGLGLDPELVAARSFGGLGEGAAERVMRPTKGSLAELEEVVRRGLERLEASQLASGGWGWWPGGREDLFMSGYALFGLSLAREAGVAVPPAMLDAGARFLDLRLVDAEADPELRAWMLHALATYLRSAPGSTIELPHVRRAATELFEGRARLGSYGQALLLLALGELDFDRAQLDVLARNLRNGAIVDRQPDASLVPVDGAQAAGAFPRAHWGARGGGQRWSRDGVETTAFALWALLESDPEAELLEQAVEWLIRDRRGAQWKNTRDTAIAILALERYVRARGLLERPVAFEVHVNGELLTAQELAGDRLLAAPLRFQVPEHRVRSGENRVELRRRDSDGPLWFALEARFVSTEEPVPARGSELFVRRTYLELATRPTLLAGPRTFRRPLLDGGRIESGRRVEVVHLVEAKGALEYLVFEDLKPAGFEAVEVKSGEPLRARRLGRAEVERRLAGGEAAYPGDLAAILDAGGAGETGETVLLHQELRERHVALFADRLPEGLWEIRYELRAETPGAFHALPLVGWAMYLPEVRANGREIRVDVTERSPRAQ